MRVTQVDAGSRGALFVLQRLLDGFVLPRIEFGHGCLVAGAVAACVRRDLVSFRVRGRVRLHVARIRGRRAARFGLRLFRHHCYAERG